MSCKGQGFAVQRTIQSARRTSDTIKIWHKKVRLLCHIQTKNMWYGGMDAAGHNSRFMLNILWRRKIFEYFHSNWNAFVVFLLTTAKDTTPKVYCGIIPIFVLWRHKMIPANFWDVTINSFVSKREKLKSRESYKLLMK